VFKIFFMKKSLLYFFAFCLISFFIGLIFINPIIVSAEDPKKIIADPLTGLEKTAGKVEAFGPQISSFDNNFLQNKTGQVIGIVLSFVGVLFFILMIYAGILWMTAQGNEQQVKKARDLLINAIIGLIIVLAAYAITSFIGTEILR